MPLGGALALGGASLVANLFGSKNAKKAAQSAAQVQSQSADKALAVAKGVYGDQTAALQPYRDAGQYALANLMARQYGGTPNQYAPPPGYGASMQGAQPQVGTQNMNAGMVGLMNQPGGFNMNSLQRSTNGLGGPQAMQGAPGMQQPGGGGMPERGPEMPPMNGPMVTVQDDSGATRQVPQAQADLYRQRGFKVLG